MSILESIDRKTYKENRKKEKGGKASILKLDKNVSLKLRRGTVEVVNKFRIRKTKRKKGGKRKNKKKK